MKSKLYCKLVAVGIIVLFMGVSFSSAISIDTKPSISNNECEECSECENSDSGICKLIFLIALSLVAREYIVFQIRELIDDNSFVDKLLWLYEGSFIFRYVILFLIGHNLNCDWTDWDPDPHIMYSIIK